MHSNATDDRVQLTVGLGLQRDESDTFDLTTGTTMFAYDEDAVTPMVGLVVKPPNAMQSMPISSRGFGRVNGAENGRRCR